MPYFDNYWSDSFGPKCDLPVFGVLHPPKYFGNFSNFISHDISNFQKHRSLTVATLPQGVDFPLDFDHPTYDWDYQEPTGVSPPAGEPLLLDEEDEYSKGNTTIHPSRYYLFHTLDVNYNYISSKRGSSKIPSYLFQQTDKTSQSEER